MVFPMLLPFNRDAQLLRGQAQHTHNRRTLMIFPRSPSASLVALSWNCCGLGNPMTVQRLKDLNKKNSPDIIFLQETKNHEQTVLNETEELNLDLHYLVYPHNQGAGGLALFWKNDINLQVLSSSHNHIDTLIIFKDHSFHSTFVYGAPEIVKHQEVWQLLTDISETRNDKPWFLTGDFNEIVNNSEKTGGKIRPESPFTHFHSFLSTCDLFDVRHTGNYLSWRGTRHTHLFFVDLTGH